MKITEELVRELQKRVDISYEEAEATLKRTKGDVNMAIYLIMKRRNSGWERFKTSFNDAFMKLLQYKLILTKKDKVILDLPLLLIIIIVFLDGAYKRFFPMVIIFIIALICECEVKIQKNNETTQEDNVNLKNKTPKASYDQETKTSSENISSEVAKQVVVTTKVESEQQPDGNNDNTKQDNHGDDDYFEIVVEE